MERGGVDSGDNELDSICGVRCEHPQSARERQQRDVEGRAGAAHVTRSRIAVLRGRTGMHRTGLPRPGIRTFARLVENEGRRRGKRDGGRGRERELAAKPDAGYPRQTHSQSAHAFSV